MNLQERIFRTMYRRTPDVATLPWHREEAPALLQRAVAKRAAPGRALDLGCGVGVYATWLASKGYQVVGIDFVPAALELARERAKAAGVTVEFLQADVIDYAPSNGFDLVLDSGCLHHVPAARIAAYRACLDRWLLPGGDFVLVHFGKRHALDWRPIGPRRLSRDSILKRFAPLQLEAYEETVFAMPPPMGPDAMAGVYWFHRPA